MAAAAPVADRGADVPAMVQLEQAVADVDQLAAVQRRLLCNLMDVQRRLSTCLQGLSDAEQRAGLCDVHGRDAEREGDANVKADARAVSVPSPVFWQERDCDGSVKADARAVSVAPPVFWQEASHRAPPSFPAENETRRAEGDQPAESLALYDADPDAVEDAPEAQDAAEAPITALAHNSETGPPPNLQAGTLVHISDLPQATAGSEESVAAEMKKNATPRTLVANLPDITATRIDELFEHLPQNQLTESVRHVLERARVLREPKRSGFLCHLLHHGRFETLCVTVIVFNAGFSAYVSDHEIRSLGGATTSSMLAIEIALIAFYSLELTLKLTVHRLFFFCNDDMGWNIFDLVLVLFSIIDMLMTSLLSGNSTNISFMRIFRLLKLSKVFRLFRALRFLTQLRLMINALNDSFVILFWCMVLLLFILFATALIVVQGVSHFLATEQVTGDQGLTAEDFDEIMVHFGSITTTMVSLYKSQTGGQDWTVYYDILVLAGPIYAVIFLAYTAFFCFALFNILTGMVVENVVKAAGQDEQARVFDYRRRKRDYCKLLVRLFKELDSDNTGKISVAEFDVGLKKENVQSMMEKLELDPKDSELFFGMLSSVTEDGAVDINAFVDGCLHLRGPAAGIDVQCLLFESRMLHKHVKALKRSVACTNSCLASIQESVSSERQWISGNLDRDSDERRGLCDMRVEFRGMAHSASAWSRSLEMCSGILHEMLPPESRPSVTSRDQDGTSSV